MNQQKKKRLKWELEAYKSGRAKFKQLTFDDLGKRKKGLNKDK